MRFFEIVKRGLKPEKKVFVTFFIDIIFYFCLILGFLIFAYMLKNVALGIQDINLSSFLSEDVNAINLNARLIEIVFAKMIGTISIFLIYILGIFTLFKGLIWTELLSKKFTLKYYLKSLSINLIEGLIFLVFFIYASVGLKNTWIALAFIVLFAHFNSLSFYFVNKENKIFKSIFKSMKFTFSKFPRYILHYFVIFIILAMLYLVLNFIKQIIPVYLYLIIFGIIIIFLFSIFRNYFTKFIEENDR